MKKIVGFVLCALLASVGMASEPLPYTGLPAVEAPHLVLLDKPAVKPIGKSIRISTYNVQDFTDGIDDGTNRTPERAARQAAGAAGLLKQINPDIALFEEIENGASLVLLNNKLPKPYPIACITRFGSGSEQRLLNVAVLSRVPIAGLRELEFGTMKGQGRPPRGVLNFYVDLGEGHRLLVYGVHLKSNFGNRYKNISQRINALDLVRKDAEAIRAKYPDIVWEVLVLGDMNVDPDEPNFARDPTLRPLNDWVDLWRGRPEAERITLPTRYGDPALVFPPATFDRFVVSPELRDKPWVAGAPGVIQQGVDTKNVLTLPGESAIHISDHYPVWVDIAR